jgi:hypothetical protein
MGFWDPERLRLTFVMYSVEEATRAYTGRTEAVRRFGSDQEYLLGRQVRRTEKKLLELVQHEQEAMAKLTRLSFFESFPSEARSLT